MSVSPSQNNSPFKTFPGKFGAFNEKFDTAIKAANNILDSFIFKWINEQGCAYEIRIMVNNETFYIKCEPSKGRCYAVFYKKLGKTEASCDHHTGEEDGNIGTTPYCKEEFGETCDVTAFKMLRHFAMIRDSVIKDVQIVLPPVPAVFPSSLHWRPQNLTVEVDKSIINKTFVGNWLNNILPPSKVESLTINSPHSVMLISNIKNMEKITNLTINAKAEIDLLFLSTFSNMNLIYNQKESKSPISLDSFVTYWTNLKQETGEYRRRIEFNCKHSLSNRKNLKSRIYYKGGIVVKDDGQYGIHEQENQPLKRTFLFDEEHLLIDVDTNKTKNEENAPNLTH